MYFRLMENFQRTFGGVFDLYDDMLSGELSSEALFRLYKDLRPPGVRLAQVCDIITLIIVNQPYLLIVTSLHGNELGY